MSKLSIPELRLCIFNMKNISGLFPKSKWIHEKTQTEYKIINIALVPKTCEPYVIYAKDDILWVRDIKNFLERFKPIDWE